MSESRAATDAGSRATEMSERGAAVCDHSQLNASGAASCAEVENDGITDQSENLGGLGNPLPE